MDDLKRGDAVMVAFEEPLGAYHGPGKFVRHVTKRDKAHADWLSIEPHCIVNVPVQFGRGSCFPTRCVTLQKKKPRQPL